MSKKINNKNAREKALLEEAYGSVYKENFNPRRDAPSHKRGDPHPATRAAEDIVDREVMWGRYSGVVDEVDVERGFAWVITDDDGELHKVGLGDFDHISDYKREREDEENPNADTWGGGMKGPFEAEDRGPGPEDEEAGEREDNIEYAKRHREHSENAKKVLSAVEDFRTMYIHELDAHAKGDGHPEDLNHNELRDAHAHLSRALLHLVDEKDADYIMGREVEQEYDMDLDPQGRREADPREY